MVRKFTMAVCQMAVAEDKGENIKKALEMLKKASDNGADIAVLPEMFNCPYENSKFLSYAEEIPGGETVTAVKKAASELGVYIAAGSIPEIHLGKLYNTSMLIDKKGEILGTHRKMHLFDIDLRGRLTFRESDTLAAGDKVTVIDTEFCKIGLAICYDIRFPELMRLMALNGAELIIVPGAFNMVTGPAHWESLIKIRAVDNQVYLAGVSPARNEKSSYVAYGNSIVAGPWGDIINKASEKEELFFAAIDPLEVDRVRSELPLLKHLRKDIYQVILK